MCYSFTLLISYMVLIHLKWCSNSFRLYQVFPILMVQMLFSQIQQAPGPDLRKVGKPLIGTRISYVVCQFQGWHMLRRCLDMGGFFGSH